LPLAIQGAKQPMPIDYTSPVASAQVKSAILLAGLAAPGITVLHEPVMSRDHTERMLVRMGAEVFSGADPEGGWHVHLTGQPELTAIDVDVPADPSSAAFPIVAALITPGSDVLLEHIGLNPARAGLIDTLIEMGGQVTILNRRDAGGEPVGDLAIKGSSLRGIVVPPARAASMIDEYPILAVAAAAASGVTVMAGIKELRVKETDRIAAMAKGLAAAGVQVSEDHDCLTVHGGAVAGGVTVSTELDHRIAMSFLVLSLIADSPITVDDASPIATSFPSFVPLMESLGVVFESPAP
jgi:3-phosphoshikimate 1-carboxyvinyltransferase